MKKKTVWFDFDNSPHPLVLFPVVKELKKRGYDIFLTARDVTQTVNIMKGYGENFIVVGKGFSRWKVFKFAGTVFRSLCLWLYIIIKNKNIACCVSCSSRSAILAGWLLRKPVVTIYDYEFVSSGFQNKLANVVLMPDLITVRVALKAGVNLRNLIHYEGLKEYFYLNDYKPGKDPFEEFGVSEDTIRVVMRPPASKSHYYNAGVSYLYNKVIDFLKEKQNIFLLILPRYQSQIWRIKDYFKDARCNFAVSDRTFFGPDVIFYADTVFGSGGTMLREAAVLGTPAISFFSGPEGAVDRFLKQRGKLTLIKSRQDLEQIELVPKQKLSLDLLSQDDSGLKKVVDCIEMLLRNR